MTVYQKLLAPFDPSLVSWRVGSTTADKSKGQALAYIDARDVMKRLDEVVGPENWQDKYEYYGETAICYLSIRNPENGEWITKGDGAGDTQVEAEKGRISDAFKRAAVKWGIGRYLYDLESPWVKLDNKKIPKEEMTKLEALLRGKAPKPVAKEKDEPPVTDEDYNRYRIAIPKAKDLQELQDLFSAAWTLAKGDEPARKGFVLLKDARKAELTQGENNVVTE